MGGFGPGIAGACIEVVRPLPDDVAANTEGLDLCRKRPPLGFSEECGTNAPAAPFLGNYHPAYFSHWLALEAVHDAHMYPANRTVDIFHVNEHQMPWFLSEKAKPARDVTWSRRVSKLCAEAGELRSIVNSPGGG